MPADPRSDDSQAEAELEEALEEAGMGEEVDREVTPVGRVSKNLLELATANEQNQNTRAYQAPAELLELARRQRERAKAKAAGQPPQPSLPPAREADAAPPRPIGESLPPRDQPTRRPGRKSEEAAESSAPSISVAPASSSNSMQYLGDGEPSSSSNEPDAAPPVARSRPSRALSEVPEPASAPRPPKSLRELMSSASDPDAPRSLAAPSESEVSSALPDSVPRSSEVSSTSPSRHYWVIVAVFFIALGFVIAKWPALERLLHH